MMGQESAAAEKAPREALPVLEVRGLHAGYGADEVLRDVTFTVEAGQRVAVVGPNGAGKSTLFKCIAGVLRPTAGTILVRPRAGGQVEQSPGEARERPARAGRRAAPAAGLGGAGQRRSLISYAPQREAVNWHFPATVYDVVMMARFPRYGLWRRPGPEDRRAVMQALEQVGMAAHAHAPIQSLSGGQKQRVFLARALAQEAEVVVLDEPFNAVEEGAQAAIVEALSHLRQRGMAVLLSTHDLDFVAGSHWFDRVMVLNGRVLAYGPPEQVCDRPYAGVPSMVRHSEPGQWAAWYTCGNQAGPRGAQVGS